jgi:hypothetical protein
MSKAHLEHSLRIVPTRYPEAAILVYTDLNTDKESLIIKRLFSELDATGWSVLAPPPLYQLVGTMAAKKILPSTSSLPLNL